MAALDPESRSRLEAALWAEPSRSVVAVLDAATIDDLIDRLYDTPGLEFECLMGDYLPPDVARVAPYAVRLERGTAFADWLLTRMWGAHWGILVRTAEPFAKTAGRLRSHFIVLGPEQRPLYFRYYDPRALRQVLPVLRPEQVAELFEGLDDVWFDGAENGTLAVAAARDGTLESRVTDFTEIS